MSLAQRFERRLESLVGGAFARVFKGQVEPVEIGSALQREASDKRNVMGNGSVLAPNRYRVTLGQSDYERLAPWEAQLTMSLAELVQEQLDENGWSTIGDVEVYLALDDTLHTGVFGVASRMESEAPPRRRPHDSMSLPIVAGLPLGEYAQPYPDRAPAAYAQPAPYGQQDPYAGQGQYAQPDPYAANGGGPGAYAPAGMPMPPTQAAPPAPAPQFNLPQMGPPYGQVAPFQPLPSYPQQPGPAGGSAGAQAPPMQNHGPQHRAMVIVDGTGRQFELQHGGNIIGRGSESDLQLLDQGVSRKHVNIDFDGSFATVYDLGSTNGTSVNGHHVASQLLRHGDVIRVGHTKLVFQQDWQ
jgi:hypothetical protein